jgi:hypothetical protein
MASVKLQTVFLRKRCGSNRAGCTSETLQSSAMIDEHADKGIEWPLSERRRQSARR